MVTDLLEDIGKAGFVDLEGFFTVGTYNFIHMGMITD
jgi:hypothetical protein